MKVITQLHHDSDAWIGLVEVAGREFKVETDRTSRVIIIDCQSAKCEVCTINGSCVESAEGELVTKEWTGADWEQLAYEVLGLPVDTALKGVQATL